MDALNHCQLGGYLVSAGYIVPHDPGEFFPAGAVWKVGCNQLVCRRCGLRVRNELGFFPNEGAGARAREIHAAADWSALPYLDHDAQWKSHRLYACACLLYPEGDATPLEDDTEDRPRPPWRRAGHPRA